MSNLGWCVVETRQGGGFPDTLHGPWWSEEDAQGVCEQFTAESRGVGRRDTFVVCALEPAETDD